MYTKTNKYLLIAVLFGLVFHGTAMFFKLESTYDAYVHLFFAEHYASNWFEPWNYKWYTGFTMTSYPPLVHQTMALLSYFAGLKFGLFTVALISALIFITGIYRYALLITVNKKIAGYTAILAVIASAFTQALHIFGQLPSIIGIGILLHTLPEIYLWLKKGQLRFLFRAISLIAVVITSHHVTSIFGMVFFIFPLIGVCIIDSSTEQIGDLKKVKFRLFFKTLQNHLKRIISFGVLALLIIGLGILPYWINSKNNPITQIPIPHGSRDNFVEIESSGLMFFIIPWGILLFILPYIFYRFYHKRLVFFGLSITLLLLLGLGGTTPLPKLLLGEDVFNILTFDRFTFWASIMALPFLGEFIFRLLEGDLKQKFLERFKPFFFKSFVFSLISLFIFSIVFTMSLNYFRPSQPQKIKMLPILNFLNNEQHYNWRYLTLGFGDQMSWLAAKTKATTVDGNYHSARRLPELTTRPIERLENSKFKGIAALGSLQQFLTTPEKHNLRYIFSNDKFYDPILFFCGWQRLQKLENEIMVWEKLNVPPLPSDIKTDAIADWQKIHWGTVPLITLMMALLLNIKANFLKDYQKTKDLKALKINHKKTYETFSAFLREFNPKTRYTPFLKEVIFSKFNSKLFHLNLVWIIILIGALGFKIFGVYIKNDAQFTPKDVIIAYYDAMDFREFKKAHQFLDPKSNVSLSQFMLEISTSQGLLRSYAKLDAITTAVLEQNDSIASFKVETFWITALEKIIQTEYKTAVKRNGKWFLKPEKKESDIPPDQLFSINSTSYFNHGKKRVTTEETYHEDLVKQPDLEIISAQLVKYKDRFSIVGEIQNVDNVPADVTLKGSLFNNDNILLASYNAKYHVKHKLMPKETSSFRIDFEGIAWANSDDAIPSNFNPNEFTAIKLNDTPTKFEIHAAGNNSSSDLYKNCLISDLSFTKTNISGTLFNGGNQNITIPQLLHSYYNDKKEILWVDHQFLYAGIRPQRKQLFKYEFIENTVIKVISSDMSNCFINGLPNASNSDKENKSGSYGATSKLQPIDHPIFKYLKIETNSYIGNPK